MGKQRLEAKQIHNVITGKAKKNKHGNIPWANHPAVRMWRGYPEALAYYYNFCIDQWVKRGYNNTMQKIDCTKNCILPSWFGDELFHASHRQTLLWKAPNWYNQFDWKEEPKYEYIWPV